MELHATELFGTDRYSTNQGSVVSRVRSPKVVALKHENRHTGIQNADGVNFSSSLLFAAVSCGSKHSCLNVIDGWSFQVAYMSFYVGCAPELLAEMTRSATNAQNLRVKHGRCKAMLSPNACGDGLDPRT